MTPKPPAANPSTPPTPGSAAEEALDQLLRQIVSGFFLLADGQGEISKWSEPAELLFGRDSDDALGNPFFSSLIEDPLSRDAEGWKGFLEMGEEPKVLARVRLDASHPSVGVFPLEAVFIPVKLDEGFDFSLFLEDLSFELPTDLMLLRLRQQHPVVIRALRVSLDDTPQLWEGWRTAGTLVAFRPLVETPWLEAALREREEAAERAKEEASSRIAMYTAPDISGSAIGDLEDAAAVVDRLKWATERIEDLEERSRIIVTTAADAAAAHARAEAAEKLIVEAQEQLSKALMQGGTEQVAGAEAERLELLARLDRVERMAADAQESASTQRMAGEASERALAETEAARAEAFAAVEVAREELQARLEALEAERSAGAQAASDGAREALAVRIEALEAVREGEAASVAALRAEVGTAATREHPLSAEDRARLQAAQRGAEEAQAGLQAMRAQSDELRSQSAELRDEAGRLKAQLSALLEGDGQVRHDIEGLRRDRDELKAFVEDARRERDEARAEVREAMRAVEATRAAAGQRPPTPPPAGGITDDDLLRKLQQAQAVADGLRKESEGLRERLDEIAGRTEAAEQRAEEARQEAATARNEGADTREEVRDAQRTAREAVERAEAIDRGAATVLGDVHATQSRLEELDILARGAHDLAHEGRAAAEEGRVTAAEAQAAAHRLADQLTTAHALAQKAVDALRAELAEVRDELVVTRRAAELRDRPLPEPALAPSSAVGTSPERLAEIAGELKATRQDASEGRLVLEARLAEMGADIVTARTEAEAARQAVGQLREELTTMREYAAAVRAETAAATQTATSARTAHHASDRKFENLRADVATMTATIETYKAHIDEARRAAVSARREADAARAAAENLGAASEANTERVTEVWHGLFNLKPAPGSDANGHGAGEASGVKRKPVRSAFPSASSEPLPEREPRPGFDDSPQPQAVVGLDGKFKQLNPGFTQLVGYKEHEFQRATWPSVHDRAAYAKQKQHLAELIAGERERVEVNSTYMHGAGLLVPLTGELTLVRDESENADHLLLVAEDRQTP